MESQQRVPANLAERLERLAVGPLGRGHDERPRRVSETLDLVEAPVQAVGVSALRRRLESQQWPWELPSAS